MRKHYAAECKAEVVLELLRGLPAVASQKPTDKRETPLRDKEAQSPGLAANSAATMHDRSRPVPGKYGGTGSDEPGKGRGESLSGRISRL